MIVVRLVVLLTFAAAMTVALRMYRARHHAIRNDDAPLPSLPARIHDGSARTWVVFTTRYCAQCGPVTEHLRRAEPGARVITIDAEREPALADSFRIRSAPTVLLTDAQGSVLQRLVGLDAVKAAVPV